VGRRRIGRPYQGDVLLLFLFAALYGKAIPAIILAVKRFSGIRPVGGDGK
jgi:hypothetical protein